MERIELNDMDLGLVTGGAYDCDFYVHYRTQDGEDKYSLVGNHHDKTEKAELEHVFPMWARVYGYEFVEIVQTEIGVKPEGWVD